MNDRELYARYALARAITDDFARHADTGILPGEITWEQWAWTLQTSLAGLVRAIRAEAEAEPPRCPLCDGSGKVAGLKCRLGRRHKPRARKFRFLMKGN